MNTKKQDIIIKVSDLVKTYLLGKERVRALRGVDFTIKRGEIVILLVRQGRASRCCLTCWRG